jgi:hypothetical protein
MDRDEVLDRVEQGMSGTAEATLLRKLLVLGLGHDAPQMCVARAVNGSTRRDGWNESQFAARLVTEMLAAYGKLAGLFWMPEHAGGSLTLAQAAARSADLAGEALNDVTAWEGAGIDLDAESEDFEAALARVAIPLLALADLLGIDLMSAALGWIEEV